MEERIVRNSQSSLLILIRDWTRGRTYSSSSHSISYQDWKWGLWILHNYLFQSWCEIEWVNVQYCNFLSFNLDKRGNNYVILSNILSRLKEKIVNFVLSSLPILKEIEREDVYIDTPIFQSLIKIGSKDCEFCHNFSFLKISSWI